MSLSVQKLRNASITSLGFVAVASSGTPVPLSYNVDPGNVNAPWTPNVPAGGAFPGVGTEYSPSFRGFHIQGFKPGVNNNGMVPNSGYIYLLSAAAGGSGNRADSGAILGVIAPGSDFWFPPEATGGYVFSPYTLYLDADSSGDGGLVVGFGGGNP